MLNILANALLVPKRILDIVNSLNRPPIWLVLVFLDNLGPVLDGSLVTVVNARGSIFQVQEDGNWIATLSFRTLGVFLHLKFRDHNACSVNADFRMTDFLLAEFKGVRTINGCAKQGSQLDFCNRDPSIPIEEWIDRVLQINRQVVH
jgi:hypothetical protein